MHVTIMAGGAGTRFWPASRNQNPKQLLNLTGERSMIQSTVDRLGDLCDPQNILVVTNELLVDAIREQLPGVPAESIIGEPAKRDTAPCVGLAAAWIMSADPDATMVVMPADHVISPDSVFQDALRHAESVVDADPSAIVTFGIQPNYPAEVFGYIERGDAISDQALPTFDVVRFREKPDAETAKQFLEAGTFYWNSGIFVWKAKTIWEALQKHQPEMCGHLSAIADAIGSDSFAEVLRKEFTAIKGTSIDYAVMERYENVKVIEAPYRWDDLGNWTAVPRQRGVDDQGNTVDAERTITLDTSNTIIRSDDDHLIVTLGMEDCIIVRTADATLIANRNNEAAIKQVVKELEDRGWNEYL